MSQRRELLEPEQVLIVALGLVVTLVLPVVVAAVLDTGEGFGHGRSESILSAPSGSLQTNSNAPMRSPGLHMLVECRKVSASNED